MRSSRYAILSTLSAAALAVAASLPAMAASGDRAGATFIDRSGNEIGKASLTETPNGLLIHVEVRGLAPGPHAFHIHGVGKCEASAGFKSAGGHFAPGGHKH
ncbi:MAG: superoxide dismutase family protein, partial [Reyranellaceae bacterium]